MTATMKITDVMVAVDTVGCGYRVVELKDGEKFAFVWGNIPSRSEDELPEIVGGNTDEDGVEIYDTYEEAEVAYCACAEALESMGGASKRTAYEMLSVLS